MRALGLVPCALACLSLHRLVAMYDADPAHWSPGLVAYALTAIGFLGASVGAAMLAAGAHLFDRIEVSERWRARPVEVPAASDRTGVGLPAPWPLADPGRTERRAYRDPSFTRETAGLLLRRPSQTAATCGRDRRSRRCL